MDAMQSEVHILSAFSLFDHLLPHTQSSSAKPVQPVFPVAVCGYPLGQGLGQCPELGRFGGPVHRVVDVGRHRLGSADLGD